MTEVPESSGVRRICPRCGSLTDASARFCKKCGLGFAESDAVAQERDPARADLAAHEAAAYVPAPEHGHHSTNRSTRFAVIFAVIAGLCIGGFLFYRIVAGHSSRQTEMSHSGAATIPAVSAESTPSAVKPPPEADALAKNPPTVVRKAPSSPKRDRSQTVVPISSVDTPPVLLNSPATSQATGAASSAGVAKSAPTAPAVVNTARRRAVQENDAESSPVPSSQTSDPSTPQNPPAPGAAPVPNAVPPMAAPEPNRKPAYDGPMAGMATWTGRLEKNGTLTITGGTPSIGVLSGAGLPGVPVRLTIDQTNLGFLEMPNADNGYQRVILKSHSSHDKITIHWTVIQ